MVLTKKLSKHLCLECSACAIFFNSSRGKTCKNHHGLAWPGRDEEEIRESEIKETHQQNNEHISPTITEETAENNENQQESK